MPCNIASKELTAALRAIEPSRSYGEVLRPCTLILHDGTTVVRALASEEARGFHTDWWIHPDEVAEVRLCPFRMPAHLATRLYAAGESGMGYEIFTMDLRSGQSLVFVTGNVVDFPDLPDGITTDDVLDVHPHEDRERAVRESYRGSAVFRWFYFLPHDAA
ncbi:MAG: hypothetical protein HY608_00345 [Planctomycetes bacterium]|nr:hypothetical protein [Planctomycetota bacterium]